MRLSLFIITLLFPAFCVAQANIFYLKNDGLPVQSKDSADIVRVITAPDAGSELFNVIDYYPDGKRKAIGTSMTPDVAIFQGIRLTFFKNGKRKATETFDKGLLTDESDEYFPNGKLYVHKKYEITQVTKPGATFPVRKSTVLVVAAYDSAGVQKVTDGNGVYTVYNDSFTAVTEKGLVKDGKYDGEWLGKDDLNKVSYKETYQNGVLLTGTADFNGSSSTYTASRFVEPQFPGGDAAFGRFLSQTVRYPAEARERKTTGKVILSFKISTEGKISNAFVVVSVSPSLDAESLRVLKSSPKWKPAMRYGRPSEAGYVLPITYNISADMP